MNYPFRGVPTHRLYSEIDHIHLSSEAQCVSHHKNTINYPTVKAYDEPPSIPAVKSTEDAPLTVYDKDSKITVTPPAELLIVTPPVPTSTAIFTDQTKFSHYIYNLPFNILQHHIYYLTKGAI